MFPWVFLVESWPGCGGAYLYLVPRGPGHLVGTELQEDRVTNSHRCQQWARSWPHGGDGSPGPEPPGWGGWRPLMGRQLDKAMGKVTDRDQWQFCGLLERVWMSDTPSRGQGQGRWWQ